MNFKSLEFGAQSNALAVAETAGALLLGCTLLSRLNRVGNLGRLGMELSKVGQAADHLPVFVDADRILTSSHWSSIPSINPESIVRSVAAEPVLPELSQPLLHAGSDSVMTAVKSSRGRRGAAVEDQDRRSVLEITREIIDSSGKNELATADLTERTGLSKDTVRKYISYWQEQNELPPIQLRMRTRVDAQQNKRSVLDAVASANAGGVVELSTVDVMGRSGVDRVTALKHLADLVDEGELTVRIDQQYSGFYYSRPDTANLTARVSFLKSLTRVSPGRTPGADLTPEFQNTVVKPLIEEGLIKQRTQPPFDYALTANGLVGIRTGHISIAQTTVGKRLFAALQEHQMAHPDLPGMPLQQLSQVIGTSDSLAVPYVREMRNEGAIQIATSASGGMQKLYRLSGEPIANSDLSRGIVQRSIYNSLTEYPLREPNGKGLTVEQIASMTGLTSNKVSFGLERLSQFTSIEHAPLAGPQLYQVAEGYGPPVAAKYLGLLKHPNVGSIEGNLMRPFFVRYKADSQSVLGGIGPADLVMPSLTTVNISRLTGYSEFLVDLEMRGLQEKGLVQASPTQPSRWSLNLES